MAPILSRPLLGRLFVPSLSRAMSSGYLVHEPKYSFLRVQQSYYCISFMGPTFTRAKQKKNSKYVPQDLGLEESNKGVFDGSWKGSGEVKYYHCMQFTIYDITNQKIQRIFRAKSTA